MITETIVCVILHCSRCNKPFRTDVADDYSGVMHWPNTDAITNEFNKGAGEHGGWRRFGDRFVCSRCQVSGGDSEGFADDPDARENPRPLPAAEADKVARTQAGYASHATATASTSPSPTPAPAPGRPSRSPRGGSVTWSLRCSGRRGRRSRCC